MLNFALQKKNICSPLNAVKSKTNFEQSRLVWHEQEHSDKSGQSLIMYVWTKA